METLWRLFETSITLFQGFITIRFVCVFTNFDFKPSKNKMIYIAGSVLFAAAILIKNIFIDFEGVIGLLYSLYIFMFCLFFLKGSISEKVYLSIGVNIILLFVSTAVVNTATVISGKSFEEIYMQGGGFYRFIFVIITQILTVLVFELILKTARKNKVKLKPIEWTWVLVVLIISLIMFVLLHITLLDGVLDGDYSKNIIIAEFGIIIINIFCFYMAVSLSKSNQAVMEFEIYKQQQIYQERSAESVKRQYEELRQLRHDMKQNYNVIEALHKEGKSEELLNYLGKSSGELDIFEIHINTEDDYINAILNSKIAYAKSKSVRVLCSTVNRFDGLDDMDLCVLLGNLLDNAAEGCLSCEPDNRYIEINITSDEDRFIVTVKNTVTRSVLASNKELLSTKADKDNHGYGVKTIKRITSKYNGNVNFYEEDNLFCCQILLNKA